MAQLMNYAASYDLAGSGTPTYIRGIGSYSLKLNTQVIDPSLGHAHSVFQSIGNQLIESPFESEDLKGVLDFIGFYGRCIVNSDSDVFQYYLQKLDPCGPLARASVNHTRVAYTDAFLALDSITASADARESAKISFMAHPYSANGTNPIAVVNNVALPAIGATAYRSYGMGVPSVAGVDLVDATQISIRFSPTLGKPVYPGQIWPKRIDMRQMKCTIEITNDDGEIFISASAAAAGKIRQTGEAATHANSTIRFLRRQDGGAFVDDSATEHIEMTVKGLVYFDEPYNASGDGISTNSVRIESVYDMSTLTVPLVISTGVASTNP